MHLMFSVGQLGQYIGKSINMENKPQGFGAVWKQWVLYTITFMQMWFFTFLYQLDQNTVWAWEQSYYSGATSVCVCYMPESICKAVTGTAFLELGSRNNESLKKFSLFAFPLALCAVKCRSYQSGLQVRTEAERGWSSCFRRNFQMHTHLLATEASS